MDKEDPLPLCHSPDANCSPHSFFFNRRGISGYSIMSLPLHISQGGKKRLTFQILQLFGAGGAEGSPLLRS